MLVVSHGAGGRQAEALFTGENVSDWPAAIRRAAYRGDGGGNANLEGDNPGQGLLALVVALLEVVKEALVHAAVRRVEGGRLSDSEIERLGDALAELEDAVDQIKAEHGVADAVRSVRDDLDGLVGDLIHAMAGQPRRRRQSALMHDLTREGPMLRAQSAFSVSPRGCWRLGWLGWQGSTFTFHGSGRREPP